jgi:hypothetical protein
MIVYPAAAALLLYISMIASTFAQCPLASRVKMSCKRPLSSIA